MKTYILQLSFSTDLSILCLLAKKISEVPCIKEESYVSLLTAHLETTKLGAKEIVWLLSSES